MENITYEEFINNILDTRGRFNCGEEYHERHHIIPKCCGGTDDKDNLIDLFAREHFEAHRLLALENPDIKGLTYAWWCMSYVVNKDTKERYIVTEKEYEEARIAVSKISKGENNSNYGKKYTDEEKEHLRKLFSGENNPFYGKHHSQDTIQKLRELRKDKYSGKNHPRCRKVFCIELNRTFWGAKEAEILYGISHQHISACCNGKRKTAGGYHWQYANEPKKTLNDVEKSNWKKTIYCIELNMEFCSAAEAERYTGILRCSIYKCCKGNQKTAGGYHWMYKEDWYKFCNREQLEVKKQWNVKIDGRNLSQYEIVDAILESRGIHSISDILLSTEDDLIPYEELKNINEATEIILDTIERNGMFLVFFDPDMDGISAGSIMTRYLKNYTNKVKTCINEGKAHGLESFNSQALIGVDTMIIVDSINDNPQLYQNIIDCGIKIVVVDHHLVPQALIDSGIDICLVSSANDYPNPALSGSATTWKLCKYIDELTWNNYADVLVDLAACGLIADMCSVGMDSSENRYICTLGFNNQVNPAIKKINGTYEFNSQAVSFGIAPLVNAANRMNDNENAMNLFLSDDSKEVLNLIKTLKNDKEWQNSEVQEKMPELILQGDAQLNSKCMYFFVETDAEVAGLIGNKLLERYQRPLFVLKQTDNGQYVGSMRAIGVENFAKIVNDTGIGKCLGHELAAGAFIPVDRFDEFVEKIENALKNVEFKQEVTVDIQLDVEQITDELIKQIKMINKISGAGFPPITVMISDIRDYKVDSMSDEKHLKIITPNMIFIKWNFNDWDVFEQNEQKMITCIGQLDCGCFGKTYYRQLIINDFKFE